MDAQFPAFADLRKVRHVPNANAILTTENLEQALARQTEKGRDAARVAVEMAMLMEDLSIGVGELDDEELA